MPLSYVFLHILANVFYFTVEIYITVEIHGKRGNGEGWIMNLLVPVLVTLA